MIKIFRIILITSSCLMFGLAIIGAVRVYELSNELEIKKNKYRPHKQNDLNAAMWNVYSSEQMDNKYCNPKFDPLTGSKIR